MNINTSPNPLVEIMQKFSASDAVPAAKPNMPSDAQAKVHEQLHYSSTSRFQQPEFSALREGSVTMQRGDKGAMVAAVQDAFLSMGFWTGGTTDRKENGVYGSPDGAFGGKMQTAIKNFQDNRGLPQTGVMDKSTFAELERLAPAKGETIWSPSYAVNDKSFVPDNILPNGDRAKVVVDLSENRLFLFDKNNDVKQVFSVAVGRINQATGKPVTTTGYKKVDSKIGNPAWLGEQLYQKGDVFGPKLVGLGEYNPEKNHVKNAPYEIHGTSNENSIGEDASSGCIRMLNDAVEDLYPEMQKGDMVYFKD